MPPASREITKSVINRLLRPLNLEIRRRRKRALLPSPVADPLLAISMIHSGEAAAIECALSKCVIFNGLSLGPGSWHPFVAVLNERAAQPGHRYEGSILERYYQRWQPANGLECLLGPLPGPRALENFPAQLMHVPWMEPSPQERLAFTRQVIEIENSCFTKEAMGVEHGYSLHGPVSGVKGALEYRRLVELLESIQRHGYDRSRGDITAQVLKRGDEYRFRILHGQHRAAVLAHLGYASIIVVPQLLVHREEAPHWPQVRRGVWSTEEALAYFDHHFDFGARAWAQSVGLAP